MSKEYTFHERAPIAPLKIAALESCRSFAESVDSAIAEFRHMDQFEMRMRGMDVPVNYDADSYLVKCSCPRFGTGEAKGILHESVRGTDLYVMVDITNYSLTYTVCGNVNHMSPDDHFQDLKRIISASVRNARRVSVIMPFLYESRQHKRSSRESLDAAIALKELVRMGVQNIITFDAHDPRVASSIPLHGFDNFNPLYQFIRAFLDNRDDIRIDKEHVMIISPDEGAMHRAVYFANNLGVDMGMFYKRRDYSRVIGGRNPIVAHEFLGADVKGKTVIIIDDMISSGESMLDTARALKDRGARNVIVCVAFGLFTDGLDRFDEAYSQGYFDHVITTNCTYRSPELLARPWYLEADVTRFLADIINTLNHGSSLERLVEPTEKIQEYIRAYNERLGLNPEG
ncbi:MAG: ribose-phosphate pyrophosphokinase [Lachnospiraceae bacterium]|nr:ribose-phosphate pyrophosphokinase [Lachnospiraceae bacterium]